MDIATINDADAILNLYKQVIAEVNKTSVKLGWNIDIYPNKAFIDEAIANRQMCIMRGEDAIIGAAVVNNIVNPEYDDISWKMAGKKEEIATIHALTVAPNHRGAQLSYRFLRELEKYCIAQGYKTIHLDVIDTNIPAYKLYTRNNYEEIACIEMYYEVVGTRKFWMLEHVL